MIDRETALVLEFHRAFGLDAPDRFSMGHREELRKLRISLMREELWELEEALWDKDPGQILKEASDLLYVVKGTLVALGLHSVAGAAFEEVHSSNMSKLGADGQPIIRDGKVVKGPDYRPAYLQPLLMRLVS